MAFTKRLYKRSEVWYNNTVAGSVFTWPDSLSVGLSEQRMRFQKAGSFLLSFLLIVPENKKVTLDCVLSLQNTIKGHR